MDEQYRSEHNLVEGTRDFRIAKQLLVLYLFSKYPRGLQGSTRLQKLLYLLEKNTEKLGITPFTFHYSHYGPYSQELTDFVLFLANKNLVEVRQRSVGYAGLCSIHYLTEPGQDCAEVATKVLREEILETLDEVIYKYGYMLFHDLLSVIYEKLKDQNKGDILIRQRISSLFRKEPLLSEKEESDLEDLYLLNSPQFSRVLKEATKEALAGKTKPWRKLFAAL